MKKAGKARRVWASIARISLALLVVFVGSLAIAYTQTDLNGAAGDYETHRKAAASAGLFTHIDQVNELYRVSEADNGASLMASAKTVGLSSWNKVTAEQFRTSIQSLEPQLQILEQAASRKRILFEHDSHERTNFASRSFNLKVWIKTLTEYSRIGIRIGDAKTTARLLKLATALTGHCDEDKTEVALLTRLSSAQGIETQLRDILETHGKDPAWLAIAEGIANDLDRPYDLRLALKLQHFLDVDFINQLERDPFTIREAFITRDFPLPVRFSRFLPRFYHAALSRIHERYAGTFQRLPEDPYDFLKAEEACRFGDDFLRRRGWSFSPIQAVDIEFTQFLGAIKKETAMRNVVLQSVALLKAKADPAKGLPLKDRHAVDFDGKPIRLMKRSSSWMVYSVWQDNTDDGGRIMSNGRGDWAINLPN